MTREQFIAKWGPYGASILIRHAARCGVKDDMAEVLNKIASDLEAMLKFQK